MARGSSDHEQSRLHDLDMAVFANPARVEATADLGALVTVIVVTCRAVRAVRDNATTRRCRITRVPAVVVKSDISRLLGPLDTGDHRRDVLHGVALKPSQPSQGNAFTAGQRHAVQRIEQHGQPRALE